MGKFYDEIRSVLTEISADEQLKDMIFSEISKSENLSEDEKIAKSAKLFMIFCAHLNRMKILNQNTLKSLMQGLKKALTNENEAELFRLMYEYEKIKKQLNSKQDEIKRLTKKSFENIENSVKNSQIDNKDEILSFINEILIDELDMKDILKEASENAFLSAIENAKDVGDTSYEIAKNIVYHAICEGEFAKDRLISISKVVILAATNIANESKIFANELVSGAIKGSNDAIVKSVEKFRDDLKFAPDEILQNLSQTKAELELVESDFIELLRSVSSYVSDPSKSVIKEILQNDYDSFFAKFRRIKNELSGVILEKFDELNFEAKYKELSRNLSAKFDELKAEIGEKGSKFSENFSIDDKISAIKKELGEFEKINAEKFGQKLKTLSEKAKEFGNRTYEAAKNSLKKEKTDNNQSQKD